jgi:hypothetical protein
MYKITIIFMLMATLKLSAQTKQEEEIMKVLAAQQKCWNAGDIECYMNGYWKSDSLMFIGKNGITYGWNNTLERYKKSYPGKAAMGELSFKIISLNILSDESAFIIGEWKVSRESDNLNAIGSLYPIILHK